VNQPSPNSHGGKNDGGVLPKKPAVFLF
jgi:hypothetical protein